MERVSSRVYLSLRLGKARGNSLRETPRRITHACRQDPSATCDKGGQSFEIRFWLPSAASVNGVRRWTGLRSFSTCLVSVDFKLVTSPAIKDGKVCSRQPGPIRTSNPRGYNTVTYRRHTAPKTATFTETPLAARQRTQAPTSPRICGGCRRTKPQRTDSAVDVPRRVLCPAPRRRLRNPGKFTTKKPSR